ncbi:hypothetical protein SAMD00020551_2403 [Mesobacillus selenatarsenatis SF-1]|uniref:Uncharacterized protein n=1 Tax=Mesobacillus selenatarsenatis (strain DSM 18680 / JCM 14380 / FERM P-15431 / SF-1) TaxID=1321606 RepID=A0A0A8X4Q4_MESS1|nr:hypothetical protein SAMD00020551_2403 [Mesobacillus selenatarsenatis SF-1]
MASFPGTGTFPVPEGMAFAVLDGHMRDLSWKAHLDNSYKDKGSLAAGNLLERMASLMVIHP